MPQLRQGYLFNNRYRLLRKLGEGGYSEVWLVEDTGVGIKQVLKIFLPCAQLDNTTVGLFREEFKLVYNINHPNLLKYSYFGVCIDYPYLLMPYYEAGSAEYLAGKCSETMAWRYLRDVASGLACLHAQRPAIIHQDIKPANVLLDGDGNFIITDFGISANMHSLLIGGRNSTVQGTLPYMAPEKFKNNPQIIAENDIWSLGVSIYELLTDSFPFGNRGGENQLKGIDLPARPAHISYDMWNVLTSCLSCSPEQRPTARMLEEYAEKKLNPATYCSYEKAYTRTTSGNHAQGGTSSYYYHNTNARDSFKASLEPSRVRNFLPWLISVAVVALMAVAVAAITFRTTDKQPVSPKEIATTALQYQPNGKTESKQENTKKSVKKCKDTKVKNLNENPVIHDNYQEQQGSGTSNNSDEIKKDYMF